MDIFEYIAVLTSIIIGLGLAHLLRGFASLIQHPKKGQIYWVHLCWVAYMFFTLIFWWWWEFRLGTIEIWSFQVYFFVVFYAFILFLASAMLFPTSLEGYESYEAYFYSRKGWIFGLIGLSYLMDLIDTLVKGREYFISLGMEYVVVTLLQFALFIVAMFTNNRRFHAVFAICMLGYQISWAIRYFETVS